MKLRILVAMMAVLLLAADAKDDAVAGELQKFAGDWVLAGGEKEGQKLTQEQIKVGKINWKGRDCVVVTPHQSPDPIKGTLMSIDPTKSPKEMDWIRSTGPDAGKPFKAIYEFISNDEYRVCFAPPGKDRPKEFKTQPGTGQMMHVWKRSKK